MNWDYYRPVGRNKALEVCAGFHSPLANLFKVHVEIRTRRDHAGATFGLALLGLYLEVDFYDGRHWDHANNRWEETT